jgi:hypothetical protein
MTSRPFPNFVEVARDVFSFLEREYEASLDSAGEDKETGNADVRFANATTFVNIHLERRDFQLLVQIGAALDGQVPPYGRNWFDLEFVLFARGIPYPTGRGRLTDIRGETARRRELEEYAVALRLGADDVLKGHFEVLSVLESVRNERMKYQWLPEVKRGRLL